ncbi:STAS domain-containing protein [Leptospira ognonensis]|uniref:STAS domain-containing protein n=1 Tax=Leptospira ognonensis TaxID=2484945 RepID=A0A4R9KAJ1_9LEPT|nr:SulP family inorganic anion transporter [Leptospira ognonensis]TGL63046.1 STAS domain-containing protein [Leptospira ognonensis]
MNIKISNYFTELLSASAAMLVALPSAIAFGISVYTPLGESYAGMAALSGVIGTIVIGLITPLVGGTARLVSAPAAPAAAVLSVFVLEQVRIGEFGYAQIPILVTIAILFAGIFQILLGIIGGGRLIKFIPYPVVTGYLGGLGILIIMAQLPRIFAMSSEGSLLGNIETLTSDPIPPIIGFATIGTMILIPKMTSKIPPTIASLLMGFASYWLLSIYFPELKSIHNNRYVVGPIIPEGESLFSHFGKNITNLGIITFSNLKMIFVPAFTLGFLLSIDTLKTCLVIDVYSAKRHDSNRELIGQGVGNFASSLFGGIAGSGTLGPTLVNLASGAKTKFSGFLVGVFALVSLFFFANVLQWIPVAALAGVLIVVGSRMIDWRSFGLLKNPSTVFDFSVILCVVVAAVSTSLILAAGVGILLAILLFVRDQIRSSVVRRTFLGHQKFSKKRRLPSELDALEKKSDRNIIFELQGQLFFGTTDQLFNTLEPYLASAKNIILDFRRVVNIDFTAVNLLKQIHSRLMAANGTLILANIPLLLSTGHDMKEYLRTLGLSDSSENIKFFDELDDALEYIEDEIIHEANLDVTKNVPFLHLNQFEFFKPFKLEDVAQFEKCIREIECPSGENVFNMGDVSDEMYFIRKGTIRIQLPIEGKRSHHLATFGKGDFFGDMAFLDKETRSADAVAIETSSLYGISRIKFDEYVATHPIFGNLFFESLAYTLSKRLRLNHVELSALQES